MAFTVDSTISDNIHTIELATKIPSSFSLFGSTFVLLTMLFSARLLHVPALRLIMYISVLNWWVSVSYLLPHHQNEDTCKFVGFIQQFCHLSSALWIVCLAFNQHRGIVRGKANAEKLEVFYHLTCWGVPFVSCIVLWSINAFGETEDFLWCWIKSDKIAARWVLFHVPIMLVMLFISVTIIEVVRMLNVRSRKTKDFAGGGGDTRSHVINFNLASLPLPNIVPRQSAKSMDSVITANLHSGRLKCATVLQVDLKVQRQMTYLTLTFVLLRVPWVVKAFQTAAESHQKLGLVQAEAITSSLQGFLVFSLFLSNSQVRRHFRRLRRKITAAVMHALRDRNNDRASFMTVFADGDGNHDQQRPEGEVFLDELGRPEKAATAPVVVRGTAFSPPPRDPATLRVFVGSWNLGNARPGYLDSWIPKDGYDIWVIGAQESSWTHEKRSGTPHTDLFMTVQAFFEESPLPDPLVTIASVAMWDIRMMVLVRDKLKDQVRDVEMSQEACGIAKLLGNKGAVSVSMSVGQTTLCFVCSHLAARASRIHRRNANVRDIVRGMRIGNRRIELTQQFHYLFWLGDLNYRIDIPRSKAIGHIARSELNVLHQHDQLAKEMSAGRVFSGFSEGTLNFTPTYRYERGSREFSAKKNQTPSYCDRILYRVMPQASIVQHSYEACHTITTSDHSPASATFSVRLIDAAAANAATKSSQDDLVIGGKHIENSGVMTLVNALSGATGAAGAVPSSMVMLSDIRILNMHPLKHRVDGTADPYLRIMSSFQHDEVFETAFRKRTLSPQWLGEVPTIPIPGFRATLRQHHIVIMCLDLGLRGEEDLLGACVVPLYLGLGSQPVPFRALLTRQTRRVGALFGKIHVVTVAPDSEAPKLTPPTVADRAVSMSLNFGPQEFKTYSRNDRASSDTGGTPNGSYGIAEYGVGNGGGDDDDNDDDDDDDSNDASDSAHVTKMIE
eukprot:c9916_g1_i1.p1 GENE.c9916_g1_i1~~c9916_g1_i1.p1  ORF type:complete len:956 (-),score=221.07 c9916_g1_i1:356-3223(-)